MHIMTEFFNELSAQGIRYAHFKSNVNLDFSFNKTGDFDVIVDPRRQRDLYSVLVKLNAKQMNTIKEKHYPGVDNWLFFDPESGNIHHLHLHYQLISGKAYIKEYEIPWREKILDTRVFNEEFQVYTSDPNMEIILLNVRSVIKSRMKDWIKSRIGLYKTHKSLQDERSQIIDKCDKAVVEEYAKELFGKYYSDKLLDIIYKAKINSGEFRKLTKIVRKSLKHYRVRGGFSSTCQSFTRKCNFYYHRIRKKKGKFDYNRKTALTTGGIFAFVGVDGAGKSTVVKEIYKWISRQFDCQLVYMGLGDGKTTPLTASLKKMRSISGAKSGESINSSKYVQKDPITFFKNPKTYIRKRLWISAIYSVEKNNYKKMIKMNRYRIGGGLSVLDRYPQIELPNKNDGPKIEAYKKVIKADRYIDRKVRKEMKALSIVTEIKPDIIFRICITAEESMKRKPEQTDIVSVQNKIDELKSITFQGAKIVDIDGMQPYDKELISIKQAIWDYL